MTETQAIAGQGDTNATYKPSAGQCDKCGQFKTWEFKVRNNKSGKMMPGHIDASGHVIGNGDCPFYAKRAKAATTSNDAARDLFNLPQAGSAAGQAPPQAASSNVVNVIEHVVRAEKVAGGIAITAGNVRVELASREAMVLCREILSRLAGE